MEELDTTFLWIKGNFTKILAIFCDASFHVVGMSSTSLGTQRILNCRRRGGASIRHLKD